MNKGKAKNPTRWQRRRAAVFGKWADDPGMALAESLERLAQMRQWRKGDSPLYSPAEFERLSRQVNSQCITWLRAAVRCDDDDGIVYAAGHVRRLADAIEALREIRSGRTADKLRRTVLDSLYTSLRKQTDGRQAGRLTAKELAAKLGTTADEARRLAKECGLESLLIADRRGRPKGSRNIRH